MFTITEKGYSLEWFVESMSGRFKISQRYVNENLRLRYPSIEINNSSIFATERLAMYRITGNGKIHRGFKNSLRHSHSRNEKGIESFKITQRSSENPGRNSMPRIFGRRRI